MHTAAWHPGLGMQFHFLWGKIRISYLMSEIASNFKRQPKIKLTFLQQGARSPPGHTFTVYRGCLTSMALSQEPRTNQTHPHPRHPPVLMLQGPSEAWAGPRQDGAGSCQDGRSLAGMGRGLGVADPAPPPPAARGKLPSAGQPIRARRTPAFRCAVTQCHVQHSYPL